MQFRSSRPSYFLLSTFYFSLYLLSPACQFNITVIGVDDDSGSD